MIDPEHVLTTITATPFSAVQARTHGVCIYQLTVFGRPGSLCCVVVSFSNCEDKAATTALWSGQGADHRGQVQVV